MKGARENFGPGRARTIDAVGTVIVALEAEAFNPPGGGG